MTERLGFFYGFMTNIRSEILTRQQAAFDYLSTKRTLWDDVEKLFHNQLQDSISLKGNSRVFDPRLTTLTLERGYRVMAQMQTGKVKAISTNDIGTDKLMNLILDKYVIPNAKAQFNLLTKFRMVDIYSNLYGNFFSLIDWDVKKNGYIGPDLWLLNIRDVFPQVGAVSIEDSDYIIVRTWRPLSYFENLKKQNGFKNIDKIITKLKDKTGSKDTRDNKSKSKREEDQYPNESPAQHKGYFEVLTQYEGDRWVDFCTDAELEFRDQNNPHDNGELPIVCKYSIPLLDDFMGMGDFERGKSMQMVVNSNWNLYTKACEMSIFPPVIVNKDNIASESSFQYIPAAKWLGRGQINNVALPMNLNPQGIATFNTTQAAAVGSLLNIFGTTDTSVNQNQDQAFGKTPQALKMQYNRESTRDNADRFYMEMFVKDVMKKMVNLISKKQSKAITIRLFGDEIDQLKRSYPEIQELYDDTTGKLNINKSKTGSVLYDYEIVSGSTYAADKQSQQENLQMLLQIFMKAQTPQGNWLVEMLKQNGYNFKFGEFFKRIVSETGIQDWDKMLEEQTEEEKVNAVMSQKSVQLQQMIAQMQAEGGNMNQVPSQPGALTAQPPQAEPQAIPQVQGVPGMEAPLG